MIVVGVNAFHPDSSIAIIDGGKLIWASEEERFTRVKHVAGFPSEALKNGIIESKIDPHKINAFVVSKDPSAHLPRKILYGLTNFGHANRLIKRKLVGYLKPDQASIYIDHIMLDFGVKSKSNVVHIEHHLCHAASSYYVSGFDNAAILSIDGMGDFSSTMLSKGERFKISKLDHIFYPNSAGFLYTAASQFIGFPYYGDEFKVMGLAAYGKPKYVKEFESIFKLLPKGKFCLNPQYFSQFNGEESLSWNEGQPHVGELFSAKWQQLFGPVRKTDEPILQKHMDIAASVQASLETIYFHVLNHLHSLTRVDNLCLAGGVAFNSVANGKITKNTPFKNVYIQPAAGDSGTALGAALYYYHQKNTVSNQFEMPHAQWGSTFTNAQIETALAESKLKFEVLGDNELCAVVAKKIVDGAVVGWFQGAVEFGPRALGGRSILADPRRSDMKDILNARIKRRESFRPFAPAVLEEEASNFFVMDAPESPFMLKVFDVIPSKRELLPAITHVDGTARVQTVNKIHQPMYWSLIAKFGELTGIPILLNTSFNENEPIVRSPMEAISCYVKTKMDVLVLGNYVVKRES